MQLKYIVVPTEKGFITDPPSRASADAAGIDLRASIDQPITIRPGETVMVPLGIAAEIPRGYVGILAARSGLGIKHGVTLVNGIGVIDADYRGEIRAGLVKRGTEKYIIEPNERICQLIIMPCLICDCLLCESLGETERGEGGYGSTGRN